MRAVVLLFVHLIVSVAKLLGPGGGKGLLAETLLLRHQLIVLTRTRERAPNLKSADRVFLGLCSLFMTNQRLHRTAIAVRPATILGFHATLRRRKYRRLFSARSRGKPGPKGPSPEIIRAIVEMKRRNPRFGCPGIARQVTRLFDVEIDKDVVRRILARLYRPEPGGGPSWLTFLGQIRDSLWSVDLFRCESVLLKTHWVLLVMDQYSRRIVGFAVQAGDVDGLALCRMFNQVIGGAGLPHHLSSDNDPLFTYHRWLANLRVLEIDEIKTVPRVPVSHPFVERLIGTVRREYLDQTLFWNAYDLESKLAEYRAYYNEERAHASLGGQTPSESAGDRLREPISMDDYRWKQHCRGLFQLPIAA